MDKENTEEKKYDDVVPILIGDCPICGKGQMRKGTAGYTCNYFVSFEEKCTFTIYSSYHSVEITEEIAKEILEKGETGLMVFSKKENPGEKFTARLKIEDGVVKSVFPPALLDNPCPICGEAVKEISSGFACQNFFKSDENHCNLWVSKSISGGTITREDVEKLLRSGKTDIIDGFNTSGKPYSSRLIIDKSGNVKLDSEVCKCPKCGGRIYIGLKAYNCSNFRNPDIKCNFVIWRIISGRSITPEDATDLCEHGITPLLDGFVSQNGDVYSKQLRLNEAFQVVKA